MKRCMGWWCFEEVMESVEYSCIERKCDSLASRRPFPGQHPMSVARARRFGARLCRPVLVGIQVPRRLPRMERCRHIQASALLRNRKDDQSSLEAHRRNICTPTPPDRTGPAPSRWDLYLSFVTFISQPSECCYWPTGRKGTAAVGLHVHFGTTTLQDGNGDALI